MIDKWHFCIYVAQQIELLYGPDIYHACGQDAIDILMTWCEENFEVIRYPDDDEIVEVIDRLCKGEK